MISQAILHQLVAKMVKATGTRGIETMCESLGIEFKGICDTITKNFGPLDGSKRSPAQLALDYLMLVAAIGYTFASGDHLDGNDSPV